MRSHPLTAWGVREDILDRLFTDTSGALLTTVDKAAEWVVGTVIGATSLSVVHVNTDNVVTANDYSHLKRPHIGKERDSLFSNCHRGVSEGDYTLHYQDTAKRMGSYINRGAGLQGVSDADKFFCQDMSCADAPGVFNWLPNTYFSKKLLLFGGADCASAVRRALEEKGFVFVDEPQGFEASYLQGRQIVQAINNGASWPVVEEQRS